MEELNKVWLEGVCMPEDYAREKEINDKLLSGETRSVRYEAKRCAEDGRVITLDFMRWRTEYEGRPAIIGTAIDITERKRAEEALKESEAKFRSLTEEALVGVYLIQEMKYAYINPEICRMTGYSAEELKEMPSFAEIVHPDFRGLAKAGAGNILSGNEESRRFESRWIKKDGTAIHVEGTAKFTVYNGKPAAVGIIQDVTGRKKAEEALRESEAKFRTLSEGASVGIYLYQDMKLLYINPELCRITGYPEYDLLRMDSILQIVHPEDRDKSREGISRIISGELESVKYQERWVRKDGRAVDIEGTESLTSYMGRPAVIGTALDVTERKKLEREKVDFLAMVSHDFKSPLTNILGYSELLQEKAPEKSAEEVGEMAGAIQRSGQRLLRMVEDFLFHSRLESGAAVPQMAPGDLEELLRGACEECYPQAEMKGLEVRYEFEPGLPRIFFDKRLLERAVSNLLQNAVTYTPEGGIITVKAERMLDERGDYAAVSVSDTGPGIPAELQPRVFEKYFRSPTTAGTRGTGLGLAVVKLVADAHGGRAEVDCPEGKGCTFRIILPAGSMEEREAA